MYRYGQVAAVTLAVLATLTVAAYGGDASADSGREFEPGSALRIRWLSPSNGDAREVLVRTRPGEVLVTTCGKTTWEAVFWVRHSHRKDPVWGHIADCVQRESCGDGARSAAGPVSVETVIDQPGLARVRETFTLDAAAAAARLTTTVGRFLERLEARRHPPEPLDSAEFIEVTAGTVVTTSGPSTIVIPGATLPSPMNVSGGTPVPLTLPIPFEQDRPLRSGTPSRGGGRSGSR